MAKNVTWKLLPWSFELASVYLKYSSKFLGGVTTRLLIFVDFSGSVFHPLHRSSVFSAFMVLFDNIWFFIVFQTRVRLIAPLEFLKAGPIFKLTPYDWTFDSCGSGAEIDHFGPGSVSQNGKETAKVPCVQWRE